MSGPDRGAPGAKRPLPAAPLRVGIVGTGYGLYGLLPAFDREPRCEVVGICGSSPERARELVESRCPVTLRPPIYASPGAMLEAGGLDGLAIAVTPPEQEALAREALAGGLAVFAEKPLAASLEAAVDLHERAERSGSAAMVDFIFPELDTWRRARDVIVGGELGPVESAVLRWRFESHAHRMRLQSWKRDPTRGGGVLLHFGSHAFHDIEFLLGRVDRVERAIVTPDRVEAMLALASGAHVEVEIDAACRTVREHVVGVTCRDGAVELRNPTADHCRGFTLAVGDRAGRTVVTAGPEECAVPAGVDSRVVPTGRIVSRFVDWATTGHPETPSFREGLRAQEVIEAVEQRARAESGGRRG